MMSLSGCLQNMRSGFGTCASVQNMVSNPDFKNDFDTTPVQIFDYDDSHEYQNFMSRDWAWEEAVCFYDSHLPFILLTSA
jgi:hypothetical protein